MESLKEKAQTSLAKLQSEIDKRQLQQPENPESTAATDLRTIEQYTDLYVKDLTAQQKLLIQIAFSKQSQQKVTLTAFKAMIGQVLGQMKDDQNEFRNVDDNPFQRPKISENNAGKAKLEKRVEPTVESHPEYFRVDQKISHQLFMQYRALPVGVPTSGALSFQEKQHHRVSMNYLKIIQIFKDAELALQINQKLLILRSIKKFAFNQNFISEEEFIKIFKVIVHGLGYKQRVFEDILNKRSVAGSQGPPRRKQQPNSKAGSRVYRFKTDANVYKVVNLSQREDNYQGKVAHQPIKVGQGAQNIAENPSNKDQNSPLQRRQTAESSFRNHNPKSSKQKNMLGRDFRSGSTGSYLVRAIEAQKISKITWDTLFNMNEDSMHFNIVIPEIVKGALSDKLDYI